MHERTDLTQYEVLALEEAGFILFEKPKWHPKNLFGDDAYLPINKLMDVGSWLKTQNRKNIRLALIFKISTQQ